MPRTEKLYWVAVALVSACFFLVCMRGIAAPWEWGHDGYTGASFSQAARNSLRHGVVGQAWKHFERGPPKPKDLYTHHPMALHAHLVASFAVFGDHEWAARLVSATYSFATWWLLFLAVRRYWDDRTALLAGVVYALTPINMVFANFVNHEPGGVFYCLALVLTYMRWLERPNWRWAALCCAMVTMAVQFDWPGYYVAFAVAVHCGIIGLKGQAPRRWFGFLTAFSVVTLVNFFGFFGWIYHQRGSLDDMLTSFALRSTEVGWPAYLGRLGSRIESHYGIALALLVVGSLVGGTRAAIGGRLQRRSLIPVVFLFAGLVHVLVFRHAGHLHSFWTFYWSPAIAIGAASLLSTFADSLARVGERRDVRLPSWVPGATLLAAFIVLQAPSAYHSWRVLVQHGHGADCGECYFQREDVIWVRALSQHFDRERVTYFIDSSVHQPRIELRYYLDAPQRRVKSLQVSPPASDALDILLVDRFGVAASDQLKLTTLALSHPTWIWKQRFYAIDLGQKKQAVRNFRAVLETMPLWRWWTSTQFAAMPFVWEEVE